MTPVPMIFVLCPILYKQSSLLHQMGENVPLMVRQNVSPVGRINQSVWRTNWQQLSMVGNRQHPLPKTPSATNLCSGANYAFNQILVLRKFPMTFAPHPRRKKSQSFRYLMINRKILMICVTSVLGKYS